MKWVKKGLIYKPEGNRDWSKSHAQVPKPILIDDRLRIYYGTRDEFNRTRTSFIEVLPDNPKEILHDNDEPIIGLGEPYAFDEYGVMPGCFLKYKDEVIMYYTGWAKGTDLPYAVRIGMAVSKDGGITFKRTSNEPVIGLNQEKISCSQPFVVIDKDLWKMWYSSFFDWTSTYNGKKEPVYELHYAESTDGRSWDLKGRVLHCEGKAVINPTVWESSGKWSMLYSYRGLTDYRDNNSNSYRIGYAESQSLDEWGNYSGNPVVDISESGWDSEMTAYPAVYNHKGKFYLLYNGNGFGKSGFGYAILDE